jgi:excisionase family DNA binding protein
VEIYTISEAAELTGLSVKAIRNRVDRGQLRAVKRDGIRRIPRSELRRAGLVPDAGEPQGELPPTAGAAEGPSGEDSPEARTSVVGTLLERLERQASEIGELRSLTSQADTQRDEREELANLIRETREAALRAEARARIVEYHLSRNPSQTSQGAEQPLLPPGSEEGVGQQRSADRGAASRVLSERRLAVAGLIVLSLLATVVAAVSIVGLRSLEGSLERPQPMASASVMPVPVLGYSRIGSEPSGGAITPAEFSRQVQSLAEAGFQTIRASRLSQLSGLSGEFPRRPILLTFDDPSSAALADPVLARAGFRGTLLPAGRLKDAEWERIRTLADTGRWDFGVRAPSAARAVPVGRGGAVRPFLDSRRWLFRRRRLETPTEYAARVSADLDAARNAFISRGFRRPRVFAFPLSPGAGQRVPAELRRAIFRRFHVAMVDVEPARAHVVGTTRYIPRIRVAAARSPDEIVTTVATAAARARRAIATADDVREKRRVLVAWSAAVAAGQHKRAARYFAPGAVVEQNLELLLTSPEAAVAYNRGFPCRARLQELRDLGSSTVAAFGLRPGPRGTCARGGRTRVWTVIRGGKFEEWHQLDQLPGSAAPATTAASASRERRGTLARARDSRPG